MSVYTLHSQGSYGLGDSFDTGAFTVGTEFEVDETVTLTGIWFYSYVGFTDLPSACCLFDAETGDQITDTLNSSPTWSGAAGSGWVKCSYSGPSLSSGTKYVAAVYADSTNAWFPDVSGYWTTGAGSGGITNGPLSAPSSADAVNGQAVYNSGTGIVFPASTVGGYDFGVDVEVTAGAVTGTGTAAFTLAGTAAGIPVKTGTGTAAFTLAASATGVPVMTGTGTAAFTLAASGTGVPVMTGTGVAALTFAASATGVPVMTGTGTAAFALAGSAAGVPVMTGTGTAAFTLAATSTSPAVGKQGTAVIVNTLTGTAAIVNTLTGTAAIVNTI